MENLLSEGIKATPPSFVRGILKAAADSQIISFAGGLPNPVSFPQDDLLLSMERIVKNTAAMCFSIQLLQGFLNCANILQTDITENTI